MFYLVRVGTKLQLEHHRSHVRRFQNQKPLHRLSKTNMLLGLITLPNDTAIWAPIQVRSVRWATISCILEPYVHPQTLIRCDDLGKRRGNLNAQSHSMRRLEFPSTATVALTWSSCFSQANTIGNYANIACEFEDLRCIVSPWCRPLCNAYFHWFSILYLLVWYQNCFQEITPLLFRLSGTRLM